MPNDPDFGDGPDHYRPKKIRDEFHVDRDKDKDVPHEEIMRIGMEVKRRGTET